jgi:hypothetical protein
VFKCMVQSPNEFARFLYQPTVPQESKATIMHLTQHPLF